MPLLKHVRFPSYQEPGEAQSKMNCWNFGVCNLDVSKLLIHFFDRFSVAESDCNLALALDKNYVKAYARRGAARFALKNLQGAKEGGYFLKFLKYVQTCPICFFSVEI